LEFTNPDDNIVMSISFTDYDSNQIRQIIQNEQKLTKEVLLL